MTDMNNIARDLLDLFDRFSWVQGTSFRRKSDGEYDAVCLVGGASLLSCGNPAGWHCQDIDTLPDARAIEGVIRDLYPDRCKSYDSPIECIVHFNDHTDTTLADVRAVLEKTAIKIEEKVT